MEMGYSIEEHQNNDRSHSVEHDRKRVPQHPFSSSWRSTFLDADSDSEPRYDPGNLNNVHEWCRRSYILVAALEYVRSGTKIPVVLLGLQYASLHHVLYAFP